MNVLIVEDEVKLLSFLDRTLQTAGYSVYNCASYEELALIIELKSVNPDLIVLDRLLQQKDAITLLRPLKQSFPNAKVLILSAIDTAGEKALALDAGAEDYLAKPFSSVELLARLRVISRRPAETSSTNFLQIGNLVIDKTTRQVTSEGKKLHLSNKEFLVLNLLLQSPGRVFAKSELIERVWESDPTCESNVVEATITNLRKKLSSHTSDIEIRNTRNVGYWIET